MIKTKSILQLLAVSSTLLFSNACNQPEKPASNNQSVLTDSTKNGTVPASHKEEAETPSNDIKEEKLSHDHTVLSIPIEGCIFQFKNMHMAPYLNADSIAQLDTLNFTLWGFEGMDGNISNTDITIEGYCPNITIFEQFFSTIHFNNDGSGGVYRNDSISLNKSEKIELTQTDPEIFRTLDLALTSSHFPHPSAQDSAIAKRYKLEKDQKMTKFMLENNQMQEEDGLYNAVDFFTEITSAEFEFHIGDVKKVIVFEIIMGD